MSACTPTCGHWPEMQELRELFGAWSREDLKHAERWALTEARHNDRLRTAGQRLATALEQLRTTSNTEHIDALLNAWRHALNKS